MKANAYLNHGRWVVECPRKTCRGAMKVKPSGPAKLRCICPDDVVCDHGDVCKQPIEPQFPDDVVGIVETVAKRPDPASRNWEPGETVELLTAENIEHGVAVP